MAHPYKLVEIVVFVKVIQQPPTVTFSTARGLSLS